MAESSATRVILESEMSYNTRNEADNHAEQIENRQAAGHFHHKI